MTPADIIKKVRRLEIRARHLVTEAVTGAYYSSFKGRGMDFEEVREYAIGDDVRTIDWNVSAKMDRPFVKVFREEREMTLMLLIDLSASGVFGSVEQSKRERAAEIASVLAFSATQNNDKVGVLLYTDEVEHYIPPKKGRRHILRVIRDILFFEPKGRRTSHKAALDYLNRVQRRKTVVFMISDFLDEPTELFDTLALTNQRHDLISIALSDPREIELPEVGLITLEDAETGEMVEIDTGNKNTRHRYATLARKRQQDFNSHMRKKGLDWIQASSDQPYLPELRKLFARRASRH
ncbi:MULTISPECIES: DUF58 domain-containing protein [unclassified Lentimonas]|uniref:DUF58 domain-containing protein n=1 Tax=unclassified Lentimonas TaxID=2630993 RepID=UPI0013242361|nr:MULTISPECIES: DUF58 domain-containing protein [unclassified Lentimonas]CAA6677287.1 hypothetical protein PA3071 [Lentimonas sp. CC4]CAA6686088.1 hypothetical protein PA3071 [Lentimonas sp. CC6]CAA7074120.1 hypothetical protein PA3071 [Lentimonas sp. CC4]CAA7171478.1 hypothetical protein PA3071 [Lentimonas sp. CC21]CAA7181956.1 hypothetical protein PA3071 [Lentimonas sp. CC8]